MQTTRTKHLFVYRLKTFYDCSWTLPVHIIYDHTRFQGHRIQKYNNKKCSVFSSWVQINSLAVLIFNELFSPGCGMLAFCILFIYYRDFKLWFELFWVWYKRSFCICDSTVISIDLVCGWNDVNIQLLTLLTWKYVSFRLVHVQKEKNG